MPEPIDPPVTGGEPPALSGMAVLLRIAFFLIALPVVIVLAVRLLM